MTLLDDPTALARLDPHDARGVLADFPAQCRRARTLEASPPAVFGRPRVVVVAGMGGSAVSGDLLGACAGDGLEVPILVHRGYGLPACAGPDALVIASSYSGETAEVLSAFDLAVARRAPIVALTAGGALAQRAAAAGRPRIALPGGLMPRMALGYLFLPAVRLLDGCGVSLATDGEVDEALEAVDALAAELVPERPSADNEAKRLALSIGDRLPAIYGGPATGAVAYRWKTDVEENAKTFALAGALPEMQHNEIEAWRTPGAKDMQLVLLRDADEPAEIARRFRVLGDLITPSAGGVSEAWGRGRGRLARLLTLTYLGQWTSYYLAILRDCDPWSVPLLDEVKRRMRLGAAP
ncbi:MAG TPA: bifunctional phosphoglucose/phosphomannose isomerase [Methylomirabilota bacterium]|jgi:glucose/mannose-6-phosphate isomerase|nr:bifunctional phosphoglucose/phosphomannose isomerase [Methylomirabilota bacterium]